MLTISGLGRALPQAAAMGTQAPAPGLFTRLTAIQRAPMVPGVGPTPSPGPLPGPPMLPQAPLLPNTPSGGSTGMQANTVCPDGSTATDPSLCPAAAAPAPSPDDGTAPSPGMQVTATPDPTVTVTPAFTCPDGSQVFVAPGATPVCPMASMAFPWLWVAGGVVGIGLLLTFLRK